MKKTVSIILAMAIILTLMPEISFAAKATQEPVIIDTVYPTDDVVIADIVLTKAPYNADNTGASDCTAILQAAIDYLYANGGGTVFLPCGKYLISGCINVLPFVTVRGDWQDPDLGDDYGTIIIADAASADSCNPALFTVGGSAGVEGLTVWYPDQSVNDVKPYPCTFYVNGVGSSYMLQSIINCTLLNSYRGIGICAENAEGNSQCHEQVTIENIKGTCLHEGLVAFNEADVGTFESITFSPKYWAEAGEEFNAPSLDSIKAYTRLNGCGFVLADLEWPEFCDIHISDYQYGIKFVKGTRISFSGTFYDIYIDDCDYGIYAPDGTVNKRDSQFGMALCNGRINGSIYAIYDVGGSRGIYTNIEIGGKIKGKNIIVEDADTGDYIIDYSASYTKPSPILYVVSADKTGQTDASAAIQAVLDQAAATDGIVYLQSGIYKLCSPLTVPAGVELRGSSSVANREEVDCSKGTLLLSYYGYEDEGASALITLAGDGAGVNGLRINFLLNNPNLYGGSGEYKSTCPAVLGKADNVYVVNSFIILASEGIVMDGCKNFFIKKITGCCYESMFDVKGSEGGYIEGCIQNANTLPRNGYSSLGISELQNWLAESNLFDYVFIPITRKKTEYIRLTDSRDITVYNTFIYGGNCYLDSENSSALIVNIGSDGSTKDRAMLNISGGEIAVVNAMRSTSDGKSTFLSYTVSDNAKLKIYDRLTVDLLYHEFTVIKGYSYSEIGKEDLKYYLLSPVINIYTEIGVLFTKIDQM